MTSVIAGDRYGFENLGRPMQAEALTVRAATVNRDGQVMAWMDVVDPDRFLVIGVDVETGEQTVLDFMPYKRSSQIRLMRGESGHLYIYAGSPARFFKYDVDAHELIDLGRPVSPARYLLGHSVGPDGTFYVGSYPETNLAYVDTATDEIGGVERISSDQRQKYIVHPATSDDNIVYLPVGLHHAELWSYNPATGDRRQILTDALMENQGSVSVYVADDGHVYGKGFGQAFRCHPDRIEMMPPSDLPEPRDDRSQITADGIEYREINPDGALVAHDTRTDTTRLIQTELAGSGIMIFSIGGIHDGKLWGGGFSPARTWTMDMETGEFEDWGKLVRPNTQIYDTFFHDRGIFLSSYLGAHIDLLNPDTRKTTHIVSLHAAHDQERLPHFLLGQDERIYGPTRPVKGHLDGGIVRVDPEDLSYQWFPLMKGFAPTSLVAVPGTTELFVTANIQGSTSAIPIHDEAAVFLWDIEQEKVVWQGSPVPGTESYRWATIGRNGIIYGIADNTSYFAFDPIQRKTIYTGDLPVPDRRSTTLLAPEPTGPEGWIVGLVRGAVFAIDPADHSIRIVARHPSILNDKHVTLHTTLGIWASPEGMLYYGAGPELWRVDLSDQ